MWEGGGETTVAAEPGCLLSSDWEGGGLVEEELAGTGSVGLVEVSPELRLVATGVILAGGTGGERFAGTGFDTARGARGAGASATMKPRQIR